MLNSFHLNMPWKDVMQTQGSHRRKYFLKTVFNSIKCTQSRIIESRVRKNFETPFYSFKVESFFNIFSGSRFLFLVADAQLYLRGFVRPSVRRSVTIKSKSGKTRISAPAHPSATDGRVSGLVLFCSS